MSYTNVIFEECLTNIVWNPRNIDVVNAISRNPEMLYELETEKSYDEGECIVDIICDIVLESGINTANILHLPNTVKLPRVGMTLDEAKDWVMEKYNDILILDGKIISRLKGRN